MEAKIEVKDTHMAVHMGQMTVWYVDRIEIRDQGRAMYLFWQNTSMATLKHRRKRIYYTINDPTGVVKSYQKTDSQGRDKLIIVHESAFKAIKT